MANHTDDSAARARLRRLGRAIRHVRGETTQAEFGARFGVPQATLSRWELGVTDLSVEQVRAVEVAAGLQPGDLLRSAGYLREDPVARPSVRTVKEMTFERRAEALKMVKTADEVGLGVYLSNAWRSTGPDEAEMAWNLRLTEEPVVEDGI